MAGVSKQKQKLLLMEQYFQRHTDEGHAVTGNELIKLLEGMGIKAERKTIYDDIATLCGAGLKIETTKKGHSNAYYLGERLFDDEELKILADAVAASRYLTIKKSNELISKLQTLTSEYKRNELKRSVYIENRTKSSGDSFYRILDTLHSAISNDKALIVTYSEYQSGERRKASKAAETKLTLSPYQIVWESDSYYVLAWCDETEKVGRYKADRISEVKISSEKRHNLNGDEEADLKNLKTGTKIGESSTEDLKIRFDSSLADAVTEKFGDRVPMHRESDDSFYIEVSVQLTPAFWGWLFQFGSGVKVIGPQYVAEIACEKIKAIQELYES